MILGIARYINSTSHDELPHIISDSRRLSISRTLSWKGAGMTSRINSSFYQLKIYKHLMIEISSLQAKNYFYLSNFRLLLHCHD